jgi:hypothetical protein
MMQSIRRLTVAAAAVTSLLTAAIALGPASTASASAGHAVSASASAVTDAAASRGLAARAAVAGDDCSTTLIFDNPCVAYFADRGAEQSHLLGSYEPTPNGNCFQYDSFESIEVWGDGILPIRGTVYSDINCSREIGTVGPTTGTAVFNGTGRSMRFYFPAGL